jgi:hypothetical protein
LGKAGDGTRNVSAIQQLQHADVSRRSLGLRFHCFFTMTSIFSCAWGINNLGVVVGWLVDSVGLTHGFVLQKCAYIQVDVPGVTATACHGSNDSGSITGTYLDASSKLWGFIAAP